VVKRETNFLSALDVLNAPDRYKVLLQVVQKERDNLSALDKLGALDRYKVLWQPKIHPRD